MVWPLFVGVCTHGTHGTKSRAIEMAMMFPTAKVIGIDLIESKPS